MVEGSTCRMLFIPLMSEKALSLILQLCLSVSHFRAPLVQLLKVVNFLVPPGHGWAGQIEGPSSPFGCSVSLPLGAAPAHSLACRCTRVCLGLCSTHPRASSTSVPCTYPANWNVKSNTSHPPAFYLPTFHHTLLCALVSFSTIFAPGGLCLLSSLNIILPGFQKRN